MEQNKISAEELRQIQINQATNWLLEMEMIDSPQLKNFLILNIYNTSKRIKNVNIIVDTNLKVMLIYLNLDFWGRLFNKQDEIGNNITNQIAEVLPSFRSRVIYDESIFQMALEKAEEMAGLKEEKASEANDTDSASDGVELSGASEAESEVQSGAPNSLPNSEEQTEDK